MDMKPNFQPHKTTKKISHFAVFVNKKTRNKSNFDIYISVPPMLGMCHPHLLFSQNTRRTRRKAYLHSVLSVGDGIYPTKATLSS
jgi:hypothetical protein